MICVALHMLPWDFDAAWERGDWDQENVADVLRAMAAMAGVATEDEEAQRIAPESVPGFPGALADALNW